jgi:hypothetical protein
MQNRITGVQFQPGHSLQTHSVACSVDPMSLSSRVKRSRREADHPLPYSDEVKNAHGSSCRST